MKKGMRFVSLVLSASLMASTLSFSIPTVTYAEEVSQVYSVEVGDSIKIDSEDENLVEWYSSDESIATVLDGTVTGVSVGNTTIYTESTEQKEETVFHKDGDGILSAFGKKLKYAWDITIGKRYNESKKNEYSVEVTESSDAHTVVFDLVYYGITGEATSVFNTVQVSDGQTVTEIKNPEPIIGEFTGWYLDIDYTMPFDFSSPITVDTTVFAKWNFDLNDTDADGLIDEVELLIKTDTNKADTDDDGLSDSVELTLGTDPLMKDTDADGISDYDEDTDQDTLSNGFEVKNDTDPSCMDTDADELDDAVEIQSYKTNPLLQDTDGDSASDSWETFNGFDPLVYNDIFSVTVDTNPVDEGNPVSASVTVDASGAAASSVTIEKVSVSDDPYISSSMAGYLGSAYNFTCEDVFEKATITMSYDNSLYSSDIQPRIYYYNSDTHTLEELDNQIVEDGKVSATVEHFSTYILLDKRKVDDVWANDIRSSVDSDQNVSGIDIIFGIDSSGSMDDNDPDDIRLDATKEMIDNMSENDRAAIIDFDSYAQLYQGFTTNHTDLYSAVDRVDSYGGTDLNVVMDLALNQFTDPEYSRTDGLKYVVILTDGLGEYTSYYTDLAIENGVVVYTIGLGSEVDSELLTEIAESTGGKYYFASKAEDLRGIFNEVSLETIDYTTDSNNDGISDYYTELLKEGKLVLSNGSDEFSGYDFNYNADRELSDDFDGDGLKNGEELEIESVGDRVYVLMQSDPTMCHSDNDGIDDFSEVQNGTDPFRTQYEASAVNELVDNNNYHFTYFADNVFDDSISMQIATAILAATFGVVDLTEIAENIISDYMMNYTKDYDDVVNAERLSIYTENIDRFIGIERYVDDTIEDINSKVSFLRDAKGFLDAIRSYSITVESMAVEYEKIVKQVMVYDSSVDAIFISNYKLSRISASLVTSKSPLTMDQLNVFSAGLNIANGVLDIADTISSAAMVRANSKIFDRNIDLLLNIRDYGDRECIRTAAGNIASYLGEGYGDALSSILKSCGMDTLEMTRALLETFVAKDPYIAALLFLRDVFGGLTGIDETLTDQIEMLVYNGMSDQARKLVENNITLEDGSYYTTNDNMTRYLTNLAQIRILGEEKYAEYYTHGIGTWFVDDDQIVANTNYRISRVKRDCLTLGIQLSSNIK